MKWVGLVLWVELPWWLWCGWLGPPRAAPVECTVVRVVVKERRDGAGEEKVLSAPLLMLGPPMVGVVPSADDAACDCAATERAASRSVDTVGAFDLYPTVWDGRSSIDDPNDGSPLPLEEALAVRLVGMVEREWRPLGGDDRYGPLCFFLDWVFRAYPLRFPFELSFASEDEVFLKLASFFIHDAKGRRRPCRSGLWSAWFFIRS